MTQLILRVGIGVAAALLGVVPIAFAQPARTARLLLTVVDQTNLILPAATVTIAGLEDATRAVSVAPAQTSPQGVATFANLAPGRYEIRAEFAGFEPGVLRDVRLRAGDNRQSVTLRIQRLQDTVTVGQDPQNAASDRRGPAFGSALTREQIDALADDPDELKRQLQDMAGPGAVIRVDSFEGGELPPKSQIKAIHVTRDAFAAENHNAGAFFIDIITQPGSGPLRAGVNTRFRSGALSGRSPFTPTKGSEQIKDYGLALGGTLQRQRSSFSINFNGNNTFDTPNLKVALPGESRSEALTQRTYRDRYFANALFDYALTPDQTLRVGYNGNSVMGRNLGIGAYDLPERAFSNRTVNHNLRIQEAGPLGRRFFINTRINVLVNDERSTPDLEALTIHVNDGFTRGGAQNAGGRRSRALNVASDLDYVRGLHSLRMGVSVNSSWQRSDATNNYLGTYTFTSPEAFALGQAASYTRRTGDPTIEYFFMQTGVYVQDDIRVKKSLTLSPGVRYEVQSHLSDFNSIGPRFGVTWSPFASGKTTLRASAGMFYDYLSTFTYEQSLRVDGFRQQELNIVNPAYPDPGNIGDVRTVNRYLLGDDLQMAKNSRVSAGADQALTPRLRVGLLYAHVRGQGLLRGLNRNPPENGIRRNDRFANVIEVQSDARSRQHTLTANVNVGGPPVAPFMASSGAPLLDFKRFGINANYTLGTFHNNTDGDFSTSPTNNLDDDWGPAANDVRHRAFIGFNSQALRNLNVNLNLNASSAGRYTIRTGFDDNSDGIFNDRPDGIGRNTEHAANQWTLNAFLAYSIALGRSRSTGPGPVGVMINGADGRGPTVTTFSPPPSRFRIQFVCQMQNLTNHANYSGFSGVMTSDFFGQATNVINPRKIDFGISFSF